MARLPSSGPLSIETINAEFRRGTQFANYLGVPHDAGYFPTDNLSIANFHGRLAVFEVNHMVTEHVESWDLYWWTRSLGWDGIAPVRGTYRIGPGVVVYGRADKSPALLVHDFPANSIITVVNEGWIVGRGGEGGQGDAPGGGGGPALYARSPVTLYNWGTIGGGGGGGAGVAGGGGVFSPLQGGGGASYGAPNADIINPGPGQLGRAVSGIDWGATRAGNGGGFGVWGEGYVDYYGGVHGSGGPPGPAVDGNAYVTWAAYSSVLGSLS